jgi:signal recognition particle GTPase
MFKTRKVLEAIDAVNSDDEDVIVLVDTAGLLRIELRLLDYIRLLSGEIQFPSPDGMRASFGI